MATQKTGKISDEAPRPHHLDNWVRGVGLHSLANLTDNTKQAKQSKEDLLKKVSLNSVAQMSLQPGPPPKWTFSEYDPAEAMAMLHPRAPFNNDTAVIIDLCDEASDQELDGSRTDLSNHTDAETEAKVRLEQLNGSKQTNRDEERQSHYERNLQPRNSYGSTSSTFPELVSVKSEKSCTEMKTVRAPSELPRHLLDQIDEWYDADPGKLPPFATACNYKLSLYQTLKGAPMIYWHKSGKPLEVSWVELPKHLYPASLTKRGTWRVLVAKGESIPPFICRYHGPCKNNKFSSTGTIFKAWVGMDAINKNGFELEPSVFKVPAQMEITDKSAPLEQELPEKTHQNNSRSPRKDRKPPKLDPGHVYWSDMKRGKSEMYDLDEMVEVREKQLPQLSAVHSENSFSISKPVKTPVRLTEKPSAATSRKRLKHADHSESTKRRKYTNERVFDATTIAIDPERSHLQARIQTASTQVSSRIPDSLELHMRNSTVLLFFPDKAGGNPDSPRPRMLSICDSVGKIFAQALAGSVLAGTNDRGAMVLSLRIDNQDQVLPMVEDDEQDFEAFIMTLRQASCWSTDVAGKMTGSCTVQVRAKA